MMTMKMTHPQPIMARMILISNLPSNWRASMMKARLLAYRLLAMLGALSPLLRLKGEDGRHVLRFPSRHRLRLRRDQHLCLWLTV